MRVRRGLVCIRNSLLWRSNYGGAIAFIHRGANYLIKLGKEPGFLIVPAWDFIERDEVDQQSNIRTSTSFPRGPLAVTSPISPIPEPSKSPFLSENMGLDSKSDFINYENSSKIAPYLKGRIEWIPRWQRTSVALPQPLQTDPGL